MCSKPSQCSVEGCDKPVHSRGFCAKHYHAPGSCLVAGCDGPVKARGWCWTHYLRWKRHGDPEYGKTREDRFWEKVEKTDTCWLWTGSLLRGGYAQFWNGERLQSGHRYSYEQFVGPIPEGLEIDHLCRVRQCVNPDHLEAVTSRENTLRGETLAAKNSLKTHCKRNHEFTPENTYRTSKGGRGCKKCRRGYKVGFASGYDSE